MRISDWSSDVCSSDLGAALIRRRPDVRQAERRLAAATARIGVETAALYPTVSLGASAGTTSRTIEGLVSDSALHFSIGPLISWSFPNWDVARARIDQASATTKAQLAEFDGPVFTGASGGRQRTHAICPHPPPKCTAAHP